MTLLGWTRVAHLHLLQCHRILTTDARELDGVRCSASAFELQSCLIPTSQGNLGLWKVASVLTM